MVLGGIICNSVICVLCYADDVQMYIPINPHPLILSSPVPLIPPLKTFHFWGVLRPHLLFLSTSSLLSFHFGFLQLTIVLSILYIYIDIII